MMRNERLATLARHILSPAPVAANLPDQGAPFEIDMGPNGRVMEHVSHTAPAPGKGRAFLSHGTRDFGTVARGDPVISSLEGDARAAAGLTERTWSLSVVADPFLEPPHVKVPATISNPLTLDLAALRELGRKHGVVKVVKAMQCLNLNSPLGQGLWEGVPLATVLRACGKMEHVRRINYWGFHNNDPKQVFRSSVSYLEATEPAFGEPPVFLCYALNGEPLPIERGGPVRMIVPHAHGFKSVKWLQHISLTNDYRTSDTYASQDTEGNDPVSNLKTYTTLEGAQPQYHPRGEFPKSLWPPVPQGEAVVLNGVVMNGRIPVSHIEYWVRKVADFSGPKLDDNDPELLAALWQRCELPGPPLDWSAVLPPDTAPSEVFGLGADGVPLRWPLPYSYTPWSATIPTTGLARGSYELRARSVDVNGNAQPEPRPLPKNGQNTINVRRLTIV